MELEFGNGGFSMEGGKPENPEKDPPSKDENQQQTQPTYDTGTGNRTRATLVGGERSHHCAIPAPPNVFDYSCVGEQGVWRSRGGGSRGGGKQDSQGGGKREKWRKVRNIAQYFASEKSQRSGNSKK